MLTKIQKALEKINHLLPTKAQDSPHPHIPPNYGTKVQFAEEKDSSPLLMKKIKNIFSQ